MAAMIGSDESRGAARHVAFGFQRRWGLPVVFITTSPDTSSNIIISINSWKVGTPSLKAPESTERRSNNLPRVDCNDDVEASIECENLFSFKIPNKTERKETAQENAYLSALYAKDVFDVFIEEFLGWDTKHSVPKKGGGALGVVRWYAGSAEAQKSGDVHFHLLVALYGFPRATEIMKEMLKSVDFRDKSVIVFYRCLIADF